MTDTGAWPRWNACAEAGWSAEALAAARAYAATIRTSAAMLVAGGRVVDAWGETARRWNVHSIRKSLLGALIGIHEAQGRFDLETKIGALGIDDRQGLTPREKLATLHDLLTARSGVYHPSGYETDWMVAIKPVRGSVGPGTTWCYNNWDFNALGTAFRRLCAPDIHADFAARIALPCGMEDFRPQTDAALIDLPASDHPAYPFRMTARDLARFGELFLRGGRCDGREIVPAAWVAASVLPYSEAGVRGAYGYLWWVARAGILFPNVIVPPGTYAACGAGGHYVVVLPALDAVFVHRVDTDAPAEEVTAAQFGRLLRLVIEAAPPARRGAGA